MSTIIPLLGKAKGNITARTAKGETFALPNYETPAQTRRRCNALASEHGDITLEDGDTAVLTISADGSSSITDEKSQFAIEVAESKGRSLFQRAAESSVAVNLTLDGGNGRRLQK